MIRVAFPGTLAALLLSACHGESRVRDSDYSGTSALPPSSRNRPPLGWLGEVKGDPKVDGNIAVNGWAADLEDGAPVQKIEVLIDDRVVAIANPINLDRPDVVAAMHRDDYLRSGWGATVFLTGVVPGKRRISAVAYDSQGAKAELLGAREIEVTPGS